MTREEFGKVILKLNNLNSQAKNLYKLVLSSKLDSLSEEYLRSLDSKVQALQSKLDSIAQIEFYHIVGMADFSASQLMRFNKEIKEMLKWRAMNKKSFAIVSSLKKINSTLSMPTEYQCKVLDVNLKERVNQ